MNNNNNRSSYAERYMKQKNITNVNVVKHTAHLKQDQELLQAQYRNQNKISEENSFSSKTKKKNDHLTNTSLNINAYKNILKELPKSSQKLITGLLVRKYCKYYQQQKLQDNSQDQSLSPKQIKAEKQEYSQSPYRNSQQKYQQANSKSPNRQSDQQKNIKQQQQQQQSQKQQNQINNHYRNKGYFKLLDDEPIAKQYVSFNYKRNKSPASNSQSQHYQEDQSSQQNLIINNSQSKLAENRFTFDSSPTLNTQNKTCSYNDEINSIKFSDCEKSQQETSKDVNNPYLEAILQYYKNVLNKKKQQEQQQYEQYLNQQQSQFQNSESSILQNSNISFSQQSNTPLKANNNYLNQQSSYKGNRINQGLSGSANGKENNIDNSTLNCQNNQIQGHVQQDSKPIIQCITTKNNCWSNVSCPVQKEKPYQQQKSSNQCGGQTNQLIMSNNSTNNNLQCSVQKQNNSNASEEILNSLQLLQKIQNQLADIYIKKYNYLQDLLNQQSDLNLNQQINENLQSLCQFINSDIFNKELQKTGNTASYASTKLNARDKSPSNLTSPIDDLKIVFPNMGNYKSTLSVNKNEYMILEKSLNTNQFQLQIDLEALKQEQKAKQKNIEELKDKIEQLSIHIDLQQNRNSQQLPVQLSNIQNKEQLQHQQIKTQQHQQSTIESFQNSFAICDDDYENTQNNNNNANPNKNSNSNQQDQMIQRSKSYNILYLNQQNNKPIEIIQPNIVDLCRQSNHQKNQKLIKSYSSINICDERQEESSYQKRNEITNYKRQALQETPFSVPYFSNQDFKERFQ